MITPQNIARHELVGLEVEVTHGLHGDLEGIKGKVVDETKNTLTIDDGGIFLSHRHLFGLSEVIQVGIFELVSLFF